MLDVEVLDETNTLEEAQLALVQEVLIHAAKTEVVQNESEISVSFVDDEAIHQLNKEHRGIDRGTDVLSFALNEAGEEEVSFDWSEGMPNLLGDIIISVPRIALQAEEYGHSYERELAFLTVHGFLHLLGYDHRNAEDEVIMFTKQEEILQSYGLGRSKS
ncbi:rRNA maturation RNase YbeY [Shouchella shacheensis]|uniref:rRNA maturation RNase YbeY n=1 Tax=Shouchella shacheensis TaxID=1649580 RepID=UPI00073FDDA9|nr:rRNA maturation RNase YbeY [Shouchella shacheensis]